MNMIYGNPYANPCLSLNIFSAGMYSTYKLVHTREMSLFICFVCYLIVMKMLCKVHGKFPTNFVPMI